MRNSKKLIAVILTVVLLASMMVPALAATYQTEADKLTNTGLMNGTPGTGLDTLLTRAQGITFTVRAMGAEQAAMDMTAGAIALQMAKVKDVTAVPGWATNYAAYAIKNGITNGNRLIKADGLITFSAADPLSGRQFITMMLRVLGYTGITLDNCLNKAVAVGMLTASKAIMFGGKAQLLRDDAAYIIYSTVNNGLAAIAGGITPSDVRLVTKLVADGALSAILAAANFMYVAPTPTPTPTPTAIPTATAGPTPVPTQAPSTGGGGGGSHDIAVSAITVTGTGGATTITTDNGTLQMLAAVLPTGAMDKTVTWSVVAGTGTATMSTAGLLTAVTDGTVTVVAT